MYDIVTNFQILQEFKKSRYFKSKFRIDSNCERTVREHLIKINSHSHIIPTIQQF
jgi:hypothetical protein